MNDEPNKQTPPMSQQREQPTYDVNRPPARPPAPEPGRTGGRKGWGTNGGKNPRDPYEQTVFRR